MRPIYRALAISFALVAAVSAVTWWLGGYLYAMRGPCTQKVYALLQCGGVGILLWATLAKQGWNIQTWGGESVGEKVDQWVFRVLCVVGSFLLVLSVTWPTQ